MTLLNESPGAVDASPPAAALRFHGGDERIRKRLQDLAVPPHLRDLDAARSGFSWDLARRAMDLGPGGTLNIAQLAVDRHADGALGDRVAVRCLGADGRSQRITYRDLRDRSNRLAHVLTAAGLSPGDTLFVLTPPLPLLLDAVFGALKAGLVVALLDPLLGPEALATRLRLGYCRRLLTTPALYRSSVSALRADLPALEQVLLVGGPEPGAPADPPVGALDLEPLLRRAPAAFTAPPTAPESLALLHFTSGAGGQPKGALLAHQAALSLWMTAHHALDLHAGDVFWCSASPGDFGGLNLGLLAPLLHGVTVVLDEARFEPARCYDTLQRQGVTVWTTTPTHIRQLMRAGPALAGRHRFPRLRLITSFGSTLDAHAVWWGLAALGLPIHDQWAQTESSAVLIANTPGQDIKPGAMGQALPGVDAFVVLRRPGDGVEVLDTPEAVGELALRSAWPSMFRGYLGEEAGYRRCFAGSPVGPLFLTGDLVRRDAEGYYWFLGDAQDSIMSAGHSVAPVEVEAVLRAHPGVAEAAVVGRPDPVLGQAVGAFVTLAPGHAASDALRAELLADALRKLGPTLAPRWLEFASGLPHARDGRLMRRLVRLQAVHPSGPYRRGPGAGAGKGA